MRILSSLLLLTWANVAFAATSESGLLPELDPQVPAPAVSTSTASSAPAPATPAPTVTEAPLESTIAAKSWVDSLPVSVDVPFDLAAFPASKDLSAHWWETEKLKLTFARGVKLEPKGVAKIEWKKLPSGERGAVLRGVVRLGRGEVQILQAIVVFQNGSRWRVASSAMWVRFRDGSGKSLDLSRPEEQRGLWRADLEEKQNLLIAG